MKGWQVVGSLWQLDSSAWWIAVVALAAYLVAFRPHQGRRLAMFAGALAAFLLALVSPIAALADGYLFSAHVIQHLMLLLVAPPLLILSLPTERVAAALRRSSIRALQETIGRAPLSWVAGLGVMWLWHVPTLCSASVASAPVYVLQVVTLLLAGTAFFWPVMNPVRSERLSPPASIAYLFLGCLGCTALGILLTFTPISACPVYLHPQDRLGIMPLLQSQWGLTHAADQQLGGLMMWVPACMVYLTAILAITKRWLADSVDVTAGKGSHGVS
ncbi:MAG: cytochrome c oxidase assembly protein [Myxococcales bacterium]|jgi:putative membrane protein